MEYTLALDDEITFRVILFMMECSHIRFLHESIQGTLWFVHFAAIALQASESNREINSIVEQF